MAVVAGVAAAVIVLGGIATNNGGGSEKASHDSGRAVTTTESSPSIDPSAAARASQEAAASASSEAARESAEAAAAERAAKAEAAREAKEAAKRKAKQRAARKAQREAARKANQIIFSVSTTGPGISMVTYLKPGGFNIAQDTNVSGQTWSATVDAAGDSLLGVNMNAQNSGGGTITCRIARGDGTVIAENSSSGDYAMVTCG